VRLARPPEDIRLGEVVRASEGSAPIVECFAPESNACRIAAVCRLAKVLAEAFDALYDVLDDYTLADLVAQPKKLRRVLAAASTA
jgi:Rrf2 family nitric oxide-sensitive transcriptional repressor